MSDDEIVKGLGEIARVAPTPYLFDICKGAASRIVDLNRDLDFARKQNQMLGATITEALK